MRRFLTIATLCFCHVGLAQTVSPLFARGYTVIPEPQKVSLEAHDFTFGQNWQLRLDKSVPRNDVAVEALRDDLKSRFHVRLGAHDGPGGKLSLRIAPGSIQIGRALDVHKSALERQAYKIDLHAGSVTITANAPTGLFYGVDTFVQLLRPGTGTLWLPEGTIEDWPDLQLRSIFWDDISHLDRIDALKHALRQAAFYKVNGFVLRLDGHFEFKSAPSVVEPYALTPAELQELTDYALRYHVQLIPYLDGPAHVAFILKHAEYIHLREFPASNYEMCATNPASYKLLEGMYQNLLDANKGVKYFFLPTDEPYFIGLAHNSQCDEATLAKRLGSVGQVYAHFLDKAGDYLHARGRAVMFWGLDPLHPDDIRSLPPYLINSFVYGPTMDEAFHQRGIQQAIITYAVGEEYLFPDYAILPQRERVHGAELDRKLGIPKVAAMMDKISLDPSRIYTSVIGEVSAGWGDEGVNPETIWLAYIASDAAGWHPGSPSAPELSSSFYSLFYGAKVINMGRIYQLMSDQSQSWADSWDWTASTTRKPIWGGYHAIYAPPKPARDQTIPLPPSPRANLEYTSSWSSENTKRIALASQAKQANNLLLGLLDEDIQRAQYNRYNLEVYLTIANLCRQNFEMIEDIHEMDMDLASASQLKDRDPGDAIHQIDNALDIANSIWLQRNRVLNNAVTTWDKSWSPRVEDANGRHFLHELSDVKDHLADRTVDMSFLVYREKTLPFGEWVNSIAEARNQFAAAHDLPVRKYDLAWRDLSTNTINPLGVPEGH